MSTYHVDVPARRTAWLADDAYQLRLTEQARTRAAIQGQVRPTRLRLDEASMPETYENTQLAERDEVRVLFTFRETEVPARRSARRSARRGVCIAIAAGTDCAAHRRSAPDIRRAWDVAESAIHGMRNSRGRAAASIRFRSGGGSAAAAPQSRVRAAPSGAPSACADRGGRR